MNTDLITSLITVSTLCVLVVEAEATSHVVTIILSDLILFNELCEIYTNLPNLFDKKFLNIILYRSSTRRI